MKKTIYILLLSIFFISCEDKEDVYNEEVLPEIYVPQFGFDFKEFNVKQDTVGRLDVFERILKRQNLNGKSIKEITAKVKDSFNIKSIQYRKPFTLLRSKDKRNVLQVFVYQPNRGSYYIIDLRDSVVVHKKIRPVSIKQKTIAGLMTGSLTTSLKNKGIPVSLAAKLTKVYAWSIDFFKLKRGNKFALTYTERFIDDTVYDGVDSLQAAFFEYKGDRVYAFPYSQKGDESKIDYYDDKGKALRNFFLKAPLKFVNITSHFTKNRFHPVQLTWKAHKGTDYAAPSGTPIMTTAAGKIEQTGYTAGNGNFVKVKHDKTYSTQYLHMSKILVKRGQSVKQGAIIGKVGSTGLATGPHVCYRFWKNNVQVDALKLKLPNSVPMENRNLPRYLKHIKALKQGLDSVSKTL